MSVTSRPVRSGARAGRSQTERGGRRWWHYVIAVAALLALGGLARGAYAIWFTVTHVRTSYARVTGLVVNVAAKDDTRVRKVLVGTGDEVNDGQVVALLDEADLAAQVEQAKATLEERESALARAERELELTIRETAATVEQAEADLSAARARLATAEAQLEMEARQQPDEVRRASAAVESAESQLADAAATLRRMERLSKEGAVSEQGLDAARTSYEVAKAAVESARAELAVARAKDYEGQIRQHEVATRAAERQQAQAALKSAQTQERRVALAEQEVLARRAAVAEAAAALEAAKARLSDSVLRGPVDGIVVRGPGHSVKDGEVVVKGMPIVTVVSTEHPLWVSAAVSELDVDRVRAGQPVLMRIDAFRGRWFSSKKWFHGTVEKVGQATEFAEQTQGSPWMMQHVPVKITLDREVPGLRHGMTCRAWVDVRGR